MQNRLLALTRLNEAIMGWQQSISATLEQNHIEKVSPVAEIQPVYVCECCPKKPKKFDTKEELE
jgi:hypothetical protein